MANKSPQKDFCTLGSLTLKTWELLNKIILLTKIIIISLLIDF